MLSFNFTKPMDAFVTFIEARTFRQSVYVSGLLIDGTLFALAALLCLAYLFCCNCCLYPIRRKLWQRNKRHSSRRDHWGLTNIQGGVSREESFESEKSLLRDGVELADDEDIEVRLKANAIERRWNVLKVWGWIVILLIGAIPLWSVTMDYLYIWIGVPVTVVYLWICWALFFPFSAPAEDSIGLEANTTLRRSDPIRESKYKSCSKSCWKHLKRGLVAGPKRARRRPIVFGVGLLFFLVLVIVFGFAWEGLCISEYPFELSTRLSRRFQSSTCEGSAPCHVYLTLGPQMGSSMYVHYHFSNEDYLHNLQPLSMVYYDTVSHKNKPLNQSLSATYKYSTAGYAYKWEIRDTSRVLHMALLANLTSDTVYYFRAGYSEDESRYSEEKQFMSGPSSADKNFSFINGGDMGASSATKKFSRLAASLSPRFALIGGDIAYANAFETCYRRWDDWFKNWEALMVTPEGNYIPLATAIGNHESGGRYPYTHAKDIPFYFDFFTPAIMMDSDSTKQEKKKESESEIEKEKEKIAEEGKGKQQPKEKVLAKRSYWDYTIGEGTLIIALDSSMFAPVAGEQTAWLEEKLKNFWEQQAALGLSDEAKGYKPRVIVFYHVPMWPSDLYTTSQGDILQTHWSSLFAKYNVSVALEHHTHRYGRTFMYDRELSKNGTLHVGGGGWGVPAASTNGDPWYMEKIVIKQHILHVNLAPGFINVTAIDIDGNAFDSPVKQL